MSVANSCLHCGVLIEKRENVRVTVQKYCSKTCRDLYWKQKRSTGVTWGELCDSRYGNVESLTLSSVDATWLACAIDGEGTIGIYRERRPKNRSGYRYYAIVQVFNSNRDFVDKAVGLMGGSLQAKGEAKRGNKEVFVASTTRRKVPPVLEAVLPYLVIKQKQAELALRFSALLQSSTKRTFDIHPQLESLWLQMKDLNKRGTHSQEPSSS